IYRTTFKGNITTVDAKKECNRMENEMIERGPIDVCILGMGKNGHLGFNEPANFLTPECHIAELSQTSLMHSMTDSMAYKPNYGLTLGMANILQSKKIILLLTGPGKNQAVKGLLKKEISSVLPASFLWLHPNVHCYMDKSSI
ncbi:MAG TPA: 6-phosphogluconolactonase, partial [Arenibacter sp.]|nr:6-phosphogluconolactonase [Arenibacter sp.]